MSVDNQSPLPPATVPYLDGATGRVVQIPATELSPNVVQARVQGIEGLVWIDADLLKQGEIKHPPFDDDVRSLIRHIHSAFDEHRELSLHEWEEGFRRDSHPEQEIALWSHAADVYQRFAESEPSPERRKDIYKCVVTCLTMAPDAVWHVLRPDRLSHDEAEQVVRSFYGQGKD